MVKKSARGGASTFGDTFRWKAMEGHPAGTAIEAQLILFVPVGEE